MARCAECGFDADRPPAELLAELATFAAAFAACCTRLLAGEDGAVVRTRPAPGVWSAQEYAAHTADAVAWYHGRIARVVAEDRPRLTAWDPDAAMAARRPDREEIGSVLAGLAIATAEAGALLAALPPAGWDRVGIGADGGERTVRALAGRLVHEGHHHLLDAGRSLRWVRERRRRRDPGGGTARGPTVGP